MEHSTARQRDLEDRVHELETLVLDIQAELDDVKSQRKKRKRKRKFIEWAERIRRGPRSLERTLHLCQLLLDHMPEQFDRVVKGQASITLVRKQPGQVDRMTCVLANGDVFIHGRQASAAFNLYEDPPRKWLATFQ